MKSAAAQDADDVIGSTNFTEQVVVATLYSDVLQHAGFKTDLRANLGTRARSSRRSRRVPRPVPRVRRKSLAYLSRRTRPRPREPSTDLPVLKQVLATQAATVLTPAPAVDVNVSAVTKKTASQYHLTTLSSLQTAAPKLVLGFPPSARRMPTA